MYIYMYIYKYVCVCVSVCRENCQAIKMSQYAKVLALPP